MNRGFYKVKCSNWRTLSMQDRFWAALLPAGLYLCIHLVEGETITPMLLARRFTLNQVLVILALIFWYWMWGCPARSWQCRCSQSRR
jgi:AI-2E family transporter